MAAGENAGSGRSRRPAAAGGSRRRVCGAALRTLAALVLVLGAGCTSSPEVALPRDLPLMTDSLLLKPLDRGRLSSAYGMRHHPITRRRQMHRGIDWVAPLGTAVRAAGDGIVITADRFGTYGHYLRIDHGGGIATAYAHLDGYGRGLRPGRLVRQGDPIAKVGSTGRATGPHLHYEILIAGRQVDPFAAVSVVAAHRPDPSLQVTPASFSSTAAMTPAAGVLNGSTGPHADAVPLDAGGAPALIQVEDLLRLYAP
jgi:murein DD-endopeptidase MepM/ murein hydrolase activator NlpD